MTTTTGSPLGPTRILDMTWWGVGPCCTLLLGFLGAEVVKIEHRDRLDPERRRYTKPGSASVNMGPLFNDWNLNKFSMEVNLRHPEGAEVVRHLAAVSDVVVDNFSPGVMNRLGLGYDQLRKAKPDIIMLSLSALGSTGPESNTVGVAPTFAALSGLATVSLTPNGFPFEFRGAIDLTVSMMGTLAVLGALNRRLTTGRGGFLDVAAAETLASMAGEAFLDHSLGQRLPPVAGNRDPVVAPHNLYPCSGDDAWISIAVVTNEEWRALCSVIGREDMASDSRFADMPGRKRHEEHIDKTIADFTRGRDKRELMKLFQEAGVAAVPSFSSQDLCEDPHLSERGCIRTIQHPEAGCIVCLRPPWVFSRTPAIIARPAPLLGEHTDRYFQDLLGVDSAALARLRSEKVLV